ncbi:hypothetical protein HY994_03385 [Candidatus Micrarchaeota archaeon]|nr:hypothetical protein [Candidatus Micrarchaeota archaeon]
MKKTAKPKATTLLPTGPWVQHWAGAWSLLSCSFFGRYYTHDIAATLKTRIPHATLTSHNGMSACRFPKYELDAFGTELGRQAKTNPKAVSVWCKSLKHQTDRILRLLEKIKNQKPSAANLLRFENALRDYTAPHIAVKKVVDYLDAPTLKKHMAQLQDARLYSEPVYAETERYIKSVIQSIAKNTRRPERQIECLSGAELHAYLKNKKLPSTKTLTERFKQTALVFHNGHFEIRTGKEAEKVGKTLEQPQREDVIRGQCAHPGHASGRVHIVWKPDEATAFKNGDILVTGMTRPEYLHLFKKAAAVVTDAGGILSHAAIVARELKKPCIIGTQDATKRLKDGDWVEVDATQGIVQKK